ncbi:MAG: S-layer homology domain-containing protein, partial [Pseudomonadota bacterium]
KMEELKYSGDVLVSVKHQGYSVYHTAAVKVNEYSEFKAGLDVLPEDSSFARISFNGFITDSTNVVKPSTNIIAERVNIINSEGISDESGRRVESKDETENFIVYNLRGTKALESSGTYQSDFKVYKTLSYFYDYVTGMPLWPMETAETKKSPVYLNKCDSINIDEGGTSFVINNFKTAFAWATEADASNTSSAQATVLVPRTDLKVTLPSVTIPSNQSSGNIPRLNIPKNILDKNKPQNTFTYRFNSKTVYREPEEGQEPPAAGMAYLRRTGLITVPYEGAVITIEDPDDVIPRGKAHKDLYKQNPIDAYMARMYWSRINPDPRYNLEATLPSLSSAAVRNVVGKGLMDLNENGSFKSGSITRGECAAYLAKAFGLQSKLGSTGFKDIPPMYPYAAEINAAVSAGLISGKSADTFGVFDTVSREELSTMVMRGMRMKYGSILKVPASRTSFTDSGKISPGAKQSVTEANSLGLMKGVAGSAFNPQQSISFNEMAMILDNINSYK